MRRSAGFTYVELLMAVLIVALASTYAYATWSLSSRVPAAKRATEMAVTIATQELERLKAQRYLGLQDTPVNAPLIDYYDRYGAPVADPAPQGYKAKSWVTPMVDRNGTLDMEDLREIRTEVWDNDEKHRYEEVRTLLAFGGV